MSGLFSRIAGIRVRQQEMLARHTSFHVGGPARYYLEVRRLEALLSVMRILAARRMKYAVIGMGTNLLVPDRGFPGVVIRLTGDFATITVHPTGLECGAGVLLSALCDACAANRLAGAEFLAGIPGTIGGAVSGNAGAFGRAIGDLVGAVIILDRKLNLKVIPRSDLVFGYRCSSLKRGAIIISARLNLVPGNRRSINASIRKNLAWRWKRQPAGYSAGSFFKNPKPRSAGELIAACGLKETTVGGAMVSAKHANFIVNKGAATARDILTLARRVKRAVRAAYGITLEQEVQVLK